jgi:small subunit ribosomal protein S16
MFGGRDRVPRDRDQGCGDAAKPEDNVHSHLHFDRISSTSHHTSITMVLRLRLSRVSTPGGARRHKPFYNIVLAQARSARDSKPMEVLGTYNPIPQTPVGAEPGDRKVKDIKIDVSRAKYWLGVGAQPSDTVWRLLSMVGG